MKTCYESKLLGAVVYPVEKYIFFYGGIFSQWAECDFHCELIDRDVNCAEQAMMLYKAQLFNDDEIFQALLQTKNPREQKALGRQVKGFDFAKWNIVKYDAIVNINFDKFSQNKAWKELLLLTDPYLLVEASPTDKIWGIGMGEHNANLLDTTLWGQNLLGHAIVEARRIIINDLKV